MGQTEGTHGGGDQLGSEGGHVFLEMWVGSGQGYRRYIKGVHRHLALACISEPHTHAALLALPRRPCSGPHQRDHNAAVGEARGSDGVCGCRGQGPSSLGHQQVKGTQPLGSIVHAKGSTRCSGGRGGRRGGGGYSGAAAGGACTWARQTTNTRTQATYQGPRVGMQWEGYWQARNGKCDTNHNGNMNWMQTHTDTPTDTDSFSRSIERTASEYPGTLPWSLTAGASTGCP